MHSRMIYFILHNNLLCPEQGGFLPGLGTHDTIAKFVYDIYNNIKKGDWTVTIFFDLKKTFDTIDHLILLKKYKHFEFEGKTYNLLENYLRDRTQAVLFNVSISERLPLTHGVPQGSTLGLLVFILYVSDVTQYVTYASMRLYADDTVIYVAANNLNATLDLNQAAKQFWLRCEYNKLTVNMLKSKVMLFLNLRHQQHLRYKNQLSIVININRLETVSFYKYLGVFLDEHLNFKEHVMYILGLVARKNYILCKIRPCLTKKLALLLYKTCILPFFDIGDIF